MINSTPTDTTDELDEVEQLSLTEVKQKSVAGAVSYFGRQIILNGIGLGSQLILTIYLSPEDFGVYGYVTQFIGFLIFFSDIGLAASLIQKKQSPTTNDYRTAFTVQQLLSWLIVAVVGVLIISGLVEQTAGTAGNWILLALGLSFPLATLKTISSIQLERKLDFSKLVLPQIIEQLVFHGLLIWLVLNDNGVMSYAYAIIARSVVGAVVMFMLSPWKIGLTIDKKSFQSLTKFGVQFQLNDFLARVKDNLFFIVLGRFLPIQEFGYVSWAKSWSMYPYNMTVQNVMAVTFPTFSRLQHDQKALKRAIEKTLYFITLGIFPIIVGMSLFISPLTQVFSKFEKWEPAVLSFILFSLSIGWSAISSPLTNTLNALGHVSKTLKLMVMWTGLTWLITPLCVWKFGYNGVGIASFVIAISSIFPVIMVKKLVNVEVWKQVSVPLLSSVVMSAVGITGMTFWGNGVVELLLGMVVCGASYWLAVVILGREQLFAELKSLRKSD